MKPARLRPRAEDDFIHEVQHYAGEGGATLGARVFDAALAALKHIQRSPKMGSQRIGQLCEIPGLRSWAVSGFPLRWFYFETKTALDVVRLLGERRDLLAILRKL